MNGLTYRGGLAAMLGACALAFATACGGGPNASSNITSEGQTTGTDSATSTTEGTTASGTETDGTTAGPGGSESNSASDMSTSMSSTDGTDSTAGTDGTDSTDGTAGTDATNTTVDTMPTTMDTMPTTMDSIEPTSDSGGNVCDPQDGDTACISCVKTDCCDALQACEDNDTCSCMFDCLLENGIDGGIMCAAQCNVLNPDIPELQPMLQCVQGPCVGVCLMP